MWMSQLILFNKPYRVLSQFTDRDAASTPRETLARYLNAPGFRAAGRLDYDSEGLLILTADGKLQQRIAHPKNKQWKTCLLYTSPSPRDKRQSRMPSSA